MGGGGVRGGGAPRYSAHGIEKSVVQARLCQFSTKQEWVVHLYWQFVFLRK